jgi:hypothetical protein
MNGRRSQPWWVDLSDAELAARLRQRGDDERAVEVQVQLRDDPDMQTAIAVVLGWHEEA